MSEETNKMAVILGGKEIGVELLDGSTARVKVAQLPVRRFPDLQRLIEDESGQVALVTGQETEWVDQLTIESHEAILAVHEELNGDPFGRWLQRRMERTRKMLPDFDKRLSAVVDKAMATAQG